MTTKTTGTAKAGTVELTEETLLDEVRGGISVDRSVPWLSKSKATFPALDGSSKDAEL